MASNRPNLDPEWERRAILFTPTGRDAQLLRDTLAAVRVSSSVCDHAHQVAACIREGVGVLIVTEEALNAESIATLGRVIQDQPTWSDLPVIVLISRGAEKAMTDYKLRLLQPLGNVSLVERPVQPSTLVSIVQSALRARERQYEFREQAKALERSNEDLLRFATMASHDLQEPLRTIGSYSQLLARKNDGKLDPDSQQFVRYILGGVDRMRGLIHDLLDFSRHTTTVQGRPLVPVDCNTALGLALQQLQFKISETDAVISFDRLPVVMAHETRLVQLFQNLIANALKYCQRRPEIKIGSRRDNTQWVLSVQDNGIGIAPEHQETIFGLFQRLHSRTEYPGSGIGLATCKRIVEQYGGRMWVDSTLGEGSTFYFSLPAHDSDSQVAERQGSVPAAGAGDS